MDSTMVAAGVGIVVLALSMGFTLGVSLRPSPATNENGPDMHKVVCQYCGRIWQYQKFWHDRCPLCQRKLDLERDAVP